MAKKLKLRKRIRGKISGTAARPRLNVFRSNKYIFAQAIDDDKGHTLFGIGDQKLDKKMNKTQRAESLGEKIGEALIKLKLKAIVYDRGTSRYHGRVKTLADAIRKKGIEF